MSSQEQMEPPRFFLYVVESPSDLDFYNGYSESGILRRAAALNDVACVTRVAVSPQRFTDAIRIGVPEAVDQYEQLPILHISCHGDHEGIEFTNGATLGWRALRELLEPLNRSLDGQLLVCMSSCLGFAAASMAMQPTTASHPFLALIGNLGKPTWPETAVAFATLYHLLARGESIERAVSAMAVASGNSDFSRIPAAEAQATYLRYAFLDEPQLDQQPPSD